MDYRLNATVADKFDARHKYKNYEERMGILSLQWTKQEEEEIERLPVRVTLALYESRKIYV